MKLDSAPDAANDDRPVGLRLVGPGNIDRLRREFEGTALPLARELKILPDAAGFGELVNGFKHEHADADALAKPKARALDRLRLIAVAIRIAENLQREEAAGAERQVSTKAMALPSWERWLVDAEAMLGNAYGYLLAIQDFAPTTAAATQRRRKIGDETRSKIRANVEALSTGVTKVAAATLIAPIVGKDYSYVYRQLTVMYPGSSWPH